MTDLPPPPSDPPPNPTAHIPPPPSNPPPNPTAHIPPPPSNPPPNPTAHIPPPPPPNAVAMAPPTGPHGVRPSAWSDQNDQWEDSTESYDHAVSRWGVGDVLASLGIYFTASTGIALVLIALVGTEDFLRGPLLPVGVVGPHVALLAHAVWVSRAKGAGLVNDFKVKLTGSDIGLGFGLFVLSLIVAGVLAVVIFELLGNEPSSAAIDVARDSTDDTVTIWFYLFAILGATFVPFVEELVYRGLFWSALEKRGMKPGWILIITSALFAMIHLEPVRLPILFVIGLALGYGRMRTGRIGPSIVTHMLINSVAMLAILAELA